jgi:hypothetical protein
MEFFRSLLAANHEKDSSLVAVVEPSVFVQNQLLLTVYRILQSILS